MIARTLVPKDIAKDAARLHSGNGIPRRESTFLDSRQIVPAGLPVVPIDGRSNIPEHVPLDVLAAKLVVPRDVKAAIAPPSGARLPLTAMDERVVIPRGARPETLEIRPVSAIRHAGVLEPDVLTTGEVNLMARPLEEEAAGWAPRSNWQSSVSSILFHAMLVVLVILQPKLFPPQPPTTEEIERARRFLGTIYVPPDLQRSLLPPPAPAPKIRVDPRIFKEIAPPDAVYQPPTDPAAGKASPKPDPEIAKGNSRAENTVPAPEPPRTSMEPPKQPRFEPPKQPAQQSPFSLPNLSAGRALEESLRGAAKNPGSQSNSAAFGGEIPRAGSGGGGGGSSLGSGGGAQAFGTMELLTPTEGVDFTNYLNRVLASVRRNW